MEKSKVTWIVVGFIAAVVITIVWINVSSGKSTVGRKIEHIYSVADPQFARSMGTLLGPAVLEGNRIETLLNGAQIFPAMLAAIRAAQHTITFETYIYWSGDIGRQFAEALSERARA